MLELTVNGMTCGHCVKAVTNAVHEVDALATVEIDLGDRKVRVTSNASADRISAAIADAGYAVVDEN